jgi:hypothetical protein
LILRFFEQGSFWFSRSSAVVASSKKSDTLPLFQAYLLNNGDMIVRKFTDLLQRNYQSSPAEGSLSGVGLLFNRRLLYRFTSTGLLLDDPRH